MAVKKCRTAYIQSTAALLRFVRAPRSYRKVGYLQRLSHVLDVWAAGISRGEVLAGGSVEEQAVLLFQLHLVRRRAIVLIFPLNATDGCHARSRPRGGGGGVTFLLFDLGRLGGPGKAHAPSIPVHATPRNPTSINIVSLDNVLIQQRRAVLGRVVVNVGHLYPVALRSHGVSRTREFDGKNGGPVRSSEARRRFVEAAGWTLPLWPNRPRQESAFNTINHPVYGTLDWGLCIFVSLHSPHPAPSIARAPPAAPAATSSCSRHPRTSRLRSPPRGTTGPTRS